METLIMKAVVTSYGEKTTGICIKQLEKFGFDVIVFDQPMSWPDKYNLFINTINEDCLRVDADIIVNENVKKVGKDLPERFWCETYCLYDLYRNGLYIGSPIFYTKRGIEAIRENLDKIQRLRPEASAWRLKKTNPHKRVNTELIVGMHGFFQDKNTRIRAKENKIKRGQDPIFDFDLVERLHSL